MVQLPMRAVVVLLFAFAAICRSENTPAGRWEGSAQVPERELKLIVDLSQQKDGAWTGSIIIPLLDIKGSALADIAVKDSGISFAVKSSSPTGLQAAFKAHFSAEGTLVGDFEQAGNRAQFSLKKTGPPQVELPQHSTAVVRELEGEWKGEYELFGYSRNVTVKLANRGSDGATAEFVVVGKKVYNLPVDLVTQEDDLLTIDSHETGISFEGRLQKDGGEINGTFSQGAIELPLVLRRVQ